MKPIGNVATHGTPHTAAGIGIIISGISVPTVGAVALLYSLTYAGEIPSFCGRIELIYNFSRRQIHDESNFFNKKKIIACDRFCYFIECVGCGDFFHMVILYGFCPKIKGGFSLDTEFSIYTDETWNHEPISHEERCPVEESIYTDDDEDIRDPPIEPCPAVMIVHVMRPARFETESLCERLSLVVIVFDETRYVIEELVEVFDFLSASVDDFEIIECYIYFDFHILHRRERK